MLISQDIILDQLRHLHFESHMPYGKKRYFSHPSMLPIYKTELEPEHLYVCRLSEALRVTAEHPGMSYLCLRDRVADELETAEQLSGIVIINENMSPEDLFSQVQDIFFSVNEWKSSMQQALIDGMSLQEIIDSSEKLIGNSINISNSAFTILASTYCIETDDQITNDIRKYGYHPESTLKLFEKYHRYDAWKNGDSLSINDRKELSPYTLVNKVFRFDNTYFIHAVMICDHHPLSDGLLELFSILTDVVDIYARRNWSSKNALSHNYDDFFTELLEGKLTKRKEIESKAQYLGIRSGAYMSLMVVEIAPDMEATLGRLGRDLNEMIPNSQVILYHSSVVMLMNFMSNAPMPAHMKDGLESYLTAHHSRAGISSTFTGMEYISIAYKQAVRALNYADRSGKWSIQAEGNKKTDSPLYYYQGCVLRCLIGENPNGKEMWESFSYGMALRQLWEYDHEHFTNNLLLLRTYLWNERKATETGNAMHMHRNNVIYRIGRIEEMIGLDLSDHHTRLGIEMAFLMLEIYGISEAEEYAE